MVKRFSVIMDGRFNNLLSGEENKPGTESPFSGRITATSSLKKSRRSVQKRVVSVPIGDVDGSRLKGDGTPPADSWAWRKYGQKPIKGSPYPRGYYRCSSSKGCPARKQVERSRLDPTMLVITYACEHNHPFPASKNATNSTGASHKFRPVESAILSNQSVTEPEDEKFADLGEELLLNSDDFRWFPDVASTIIESPICGDSDLAMIFPMREEDESLFADLGELPEGSVVFRRNFLEVEEESRRCNSRTAAWCESTG